MKKWWLSKLSGVAASLLAGTAFAEITDSPGGPKVNQMNLHEPVTEIARWILDMHNALLILCFIILVLVFGVMFYSIWAHRKSRGAVPAKFHESISVEVAWTIVPFILVIALALPATRIVVAQKDTSNADITIKVTGYQWKWGYDYISGEGEGIGFLSNLSTPTAQINNIEPKGNNYLIEVDNPLVVPVDSKIRIALTAADVIHSWMVPSFGVKQDAVPGFSRDTWFKATKTGEFRGQCAELCGKDHAFMPIVVKVVTKEEYTAWVKAKQEEHAKELAALADDPNKVWTADELIARGEKLFTTKTCVVCHQATGKGVPGSYPALDGSPIVMGPKDGQLEILLKGRNAMPSQAALTDSELAALATYTRSAWSNAGKGQDPVVMPADVKAHRQM